MTLNKTFLLFLFGLIAVGLAILFPSLAWLSPLTYTFIFPIAAIWLWKNEGNSFWDLGIRFGGGWLRKLGIGLMLGLAIPVFFITIQLLGGWISLVKRTDPISGLASYLLVLLLKMILIVAVEELVFRGFFLQALSRKMSPWLAIVLSSLLWSIGHLASMVTAGLTPGLIMIGLSTFLLWGVTLSFCFLRTGRSLWFPYGLHLGCNLAFSLVGLPFLYQPHAANWWIGHPSWSPESGLIGVLVWLALALGMYWLTGSKRIHSLAAT